MTHDELKLCPFCGGMAHIEMYDGEGEKIDHETYNDEHWNRSVYL